MLFYDFFYDHSIIYFYLFTGGQLFIRLGGQLLRSFNILKHDRHLKQNLWGIRFRTSIGGAQKKFILGKKIDGKITQFGGRG